MRINHIDHFYDNFMVIIVIFMLIYFHHIEKNGQYIL